VLCSTCPAATAHPKVHILLIADDTHVLSLGPPEAVIAAILDIRERYAAIGLSLKGPLRSWQCIY
jgi:hypothetical protein